ncbi:MAG TPA: aminotransferase class V-fold PLP-dependent enzyme [Nitrospiraceae bacterium]|nr:aminotransferase class V-fold PLP-dependent enzyme [Nitrospiraceae bacterium]
MGAINRRDFLVRSGLAIGAALLAVENPVSTAIADSSPLKLDNWQAVREQFQLSRDYIHLAGFFLASHPAPVRAAIERHRRGLDANPIGYWFEHEEKQEAAVLRAVADYLAVDPTEIALTESTTMGLGLLYGGLTSRQGQEILTTLHDHYATETSLRLRAERTGATIRQIPLYDSLKNVSRHELLDNLIKNIRPNTRIIAVTWVHSSTGLKLPIQEMAQVIHKLNEPRAEQDRIIFCVDGVHALGVENFRLSDVGCDFLVAGTHKWIFGPRGTGLVWGHQQAWPAANAIIPTFNTQAYDIWMKLSPPKDLPNSVYMTPGGFHSFEHRWALDEAFRFHQVIGKARVTQRIYELNQQMKQGLAKMPHVTLHTPMSQDLSSGIVCFDVEGMTPRQVVERLRQKKIIGSVTPYATQYARLAPSLLTSTDDIEQTLKEILALKA